MSTSITVSPERQRVMTIRDLLEKSQEQIALALPRHMTAERMIRVAMTTISKTPKLLECHPLSLIGCVVQASELGLELNGFLGEAYLVPFWNGKMKRLEAQFQAGYRGMISLARRSGQVSKIYSELVFDCDLLKVTYGLKKGLVHEPDIDNPKRGSRDGNGNLVGLRGAYAVVVYRDGEDDFEYLPLAKLNELRARSKSKNKEGEENGPWVTDPDQMYKKIPIRQLAKRLPLSPEFQKAAVLDEYGAVGVHQNLGGEVATNPAFADVVSDISANATEALAEKYARDDEQIQEGPPLESYSEGEAVMDPSSGSRVATPAAANPLTPGMFDGPPQPSRKTGR